MLISIPERGSTPHLVGVCLNRIGTRQTSSKGTSIWLRNKLKTFSPSRWRVSFALRHRDVRDCVFA